LPGEAGKLGRCLSVAIPCSWGNESGSQGLCWQVRRMVWFSVVDTQVRAGTTLAGAVRHRTRIPKLPLRPEGPIQNNGDQCAGPIDTSFILSGALRHRLGMCQPSGLKNKLAPNLCIKDGLVLSAVDSFLAIDFLADRFTHQLLNPKMGASTPSYRRHQPWSATSRTRRGGADLQLMPKRLILKLSYGKALAAILGSAIYPASRQDVPTQVKYLRPLRDYSAICTITKPQAL